MKSLVQNGGGTLPDDQVQIIQVTLRSDFLNVCCEDDYILTLPKTDEQLRAARDRLGVKAFGECEIMWVDSPLRVLADLEYHGDVTLMNGIARAAAEAMEQDGGGPLLLAILDAYKDADARELKERIENLDSHPSQMGGMQL